MRKNVMTLVAIVLILSSLACSLTPASTARPLGSLIRAPQTGGNAPATVTPTPDTPAPVFTVLQPVWVRNYAGDKVDAVTGGTFGGWCVGDWCYIVELQHKVWRGCTDRADGRGCQDE